MVGGRREERTIAESVIYHYTFVPSNNKKVKWINLDLITETDLPKRDIVTRARPDIVTGRRLEPDDKN